jgi:hypothetical protein
MSTNGTNGGPWYTKFIAQVGVPSAIALFLVYFLSSQVMIAIEEHASASDRLMQELLSVSRQICLNTSTTDVARSGCIGTR